MSALYGRMNSDSRKTEVTSRGFKEISARLETWDGSIEIVLTDDGSFDVFIGEKSAPRTHIAEGNVNTREFTVYPQEGE